ncbi:MAG: tetratricopeptide repeat protein [Anaerolineae bacterium]
MLKNEHNLRTVAWVVAIALSLILAGCGGGAEITYRVGGTAPEAEVSYTNTDGETETTTVSLPWEKTLNVGSEFSFEMEAVNPSDSGTVTCEVLVNGDSLGEGEGNASISCSGNFSQQGNSRSASFSSLPDAVAPVSTPTPSAEDHLEQGRTYAEQGELDKAIVEFEKAIALDPNNATLHNDLAAAYYQQGRIDEAVATWEQALEIDSELADTHYNLGLVYAGQGKLDEAITKWEETLQIDPNYANAHKNLGIAYTEQGRLEEAVAEFETYLQLKPDAEDRTAVEEEIAKLKEQTGPPTIEHRSAAGGYSLRYPESWYLVEDDMDTALAPSREDYEAPSLQSPLFNFVVWPRALAIESLDLEESSPPMDFLQVMAERLDAETGETAEIQIAGYPAAAATTTGTLEGSPYRGELLVILVEERLFFVEALAPPDQWDNARPIFVNIVNSLSFFEPE